MVLPHNTKKHGVNRDHFNLISTSSLLGGMDVILSWFQSCNFSIVINRFITKFHFKTMSTKMGTKDNIIMRFKCSSCILVFQAF